MKKRYWLLAIFLPIFLPSCRLYDALFTEYDPQPTPDTIVLSIDPKRTEVQYLTSDSTYTIIRYWMGPLNTRLYKCLEEHYKKGRLVKNRYEWDSAGALIHRSYWDEGVKVDTAIDWHSTGAVKQWMVYSEIGNPVIQYNGFANGKKHTDTIYFDSLGRRNDPSGKGPYPIKYYNDEGRHTETYYYRNDTLLSVDIFKPQYATLDMTAKRLADKRFREQKSKDSIEFVSRTNPNLIEFDPNRVQRIADDPTW